MFDFKIAWNLKSQITISKLRPGGIFILGTAQWFATSCGGKGCTLWSFQREFLVTREVILESDERRNMENGGLFLFWAFEPPQLQWSSQSLSLWMAASLLCLQLCKHFNKVTFIWVVTTVPTSLKQMSPVNSVDSLLHSIIPDRGRKNISADWNCLFFLLFFRFPLQMYYISISIRIWIFNLHEHRTLQRQSAPRPPWWCSPSN